jgi:SAM-dependent methyltransferase
MKHSLFCPVCQVTVAEFQPIAPSFEAQAKQYGFPYAFSELETLNSKAYTCPSCGSADRDRLMAWALTLVSPVIGEAARKCGRRGVSVLDIAPANALRKHLTKWARTYRCADLSRTDVDDNIDVCNMLKYKEGMYDLIICSHVLEHVPDDARALKELHRVLSPGGMAFLLVPLIRGVDKTDEDPAVVDPGERWRRFAQDDHVRLYGRASFTERIINAGFSLMILNPDKFMCQRMGLSSSSTLYVAARPL